MTYAIQTDRDVDGTSIWQRLSDLIAGFRQRQTQHRAYRSTVRQITALSSRDLTDMGIDQAHIHAIARQTACGA